MLYLYCFFFMCISMFFFIESLVFFDLNLVYFLKWSIIKNESLSFDFIVLLDWMSFLFSSVVMFISSMVIFYSIEYMSSYKMEKFQVLLILFVFSMITLIFSPFLVSLILGWDGLGLVSYCLVIYYNNISSFNSGFCTFLTNRIGDVGIMLSIFMFLIMGSWSMNLITLEFCFILISIVAFTKSAQVPFSYWLPQAMAAPTPISALVHSSTLVTAGVYVMIRYLNFFEGSFFLKIICYVGLFTSFLSGMVSMSEFDLKKIVAFSTLSQLGLMFCSLGMGLINLCFFHLLIHAVFKSMLFLKSGILIHVFGTQDIRMMSVNTKFLPFSSMGLIISLMSLMGFPFLSGFFSKDLIYEVMEMMNINLFFFYFMYMCIVLTCFYSFRLIYYLFFSKFKVKNMLVEGESLIMGMSSFLLMMFSVFLGKIFCNLFFVEFIMLEFKFIPFLLILVSFLMFLMFSVNFFEKLTMNSFYLFNTFWSLVILNSMQTISEGDQWSFFDNLLFLGNEIYGNKSVKVNFFMFMEFILVIFILLFIWI